MTLCRVIHWRNQCYTLGHWRSQCLTSGANATHWVYLLLAACFRYFGFAFDLLKGRLPDW
jgi:hypothetical protein